MESEWLHATNLWKHYGTVTVLQGLNLNVEQGTVAGLLGPNGVGKSTAMKILAGVVKANAGQVTLGQDTVGSQNYRQKVGYLPDTGGLFPRLSAMEHLELAGRLWGVDNWEQRAKELLVRLDLHESAWRLAGGFSHGMSRRLGVALAMIADPELLLLDEPFDGVDPIASITVRDLMREEAARGKIVICSTHLLDVAGKVCDTLIVIGKGQVRGMGSREDILKANEASDLEEAYTKLIQGTPEKPVPAVQTEGRV